MSKANRAARARIIAEAKAALARLVAAGAHLAAGDEPDGACGLHLPDSAGSAKLDGHVSRPAVAYALRKGWLESHAPSRSLRISKAGRCALEAKPQAARRARLRPPAAPSNQPRTPTETPLGLLRRRRHKDGRPLVSDAQWSAAQMLIADFWRGQLLPRVTANWSAIAPAHRVRRSAPGTGAELRDDVLAARQRFQRALDAVGPELAGVLVNVCCHDIGLEAAGRTLGWPQRAAKVVLDLALTRLARHYGLIAPERPAGLRMRHWGDADFRPTIDQWR